MTRRPVDLARARAAEVELEALLTAHPELRERTALFLAGKLDAGPMEEPMSEKQNPQVVKVAGELVARARALVPHLEGTPTMAAVPRVTGAAVLRVALSLGLAELERRTAAGEGEGIGR